MSNKAHNLLPSRL